MKFLLPLAVLVLWGCATAPPAISALQVKAFDDVVRSAEAAGACDNPPEAARQLRDAKSDFYYAEHSPMDPNRARRTLVTAQAEAEAARDLAQRNVRHETSLGSVARIEPPKRPSGD
jgi:hypothetical protein